MFFDFNLYLICQYFSFWKKKKNSHYNQGKKKSDFLSFLLEYSNGKNKQ